MVATGRHGDSHMDYRGSRVRMAEPAACAEYAAPAPVSEQILERGLVNLVRRRCQSEAGLWRNGMVGRTEVGAHVKWRAPGISGGHQWRANLICKRRVFSNAGCRGGRTKRAVSAGNVGDLACPRNIAAVGGIGGKADLSWIQVFAQQLNSRRLLVIFKRKGCCGRIRKIPCITCASEQRKPCKRATIVRMMGRLQTQ